MIELGDKVKDKITGFTGIVISRIEYINGCIQFGIKSLVKNNESPKDTWYIDEKELKIVAKNVAKIEMKRTGGEMKKIFSQTGPRGINP